MKQLERMSDFFNTRCGSYDEVHTGHIGGGIEGKRVVAGLLPDQMRTLLDLGIGTGLELEAIFERFPDVQVVGLDISEGMLASLRAKYRQQYDAGQIELRQMSYLDYAYGETLFDAVVTVMTLHHYDHQAKTDLYRKIRRTLADGGVYVESDYMLSELVHPDAQALEDEYFATYAALKREQGLGIEEYHYDTPCTVPNQLAMMREAGFSQAEVTHRFGDTIVVRCVR